jgi:hypothetical protein
MQVIIASEALDSPLEHAASAERIVASEALDSLLEHAASAERIVASEALDSLLEQSEPRFPAVAPQGSPASERARLRGYLERLLGWDDAPAIEHALRSVYLAATHQAALMLCGDGDLVQVARGLHRHVLGNEQPFVLCDPRRHDTGAGAHLENHTTGMIALAAATGGSVCLRSKRLPRDFVKLAAVLREPGACVQLILCGPRPPVRTDLVLAPIKIPALSTRYHELDRIIDEYAREAAVALQSSAPFTATDRDWVRTHSATSLPEIEKGAWRILALRETGNIRRAAALLGVGHTALGEWFSHRRPERSVRKGDGPDPLAETRRSVRKRDGPDPLAQTRGILSAARALRQDLRRQQKAM